MRMCCFINCERRMFDCCIFLLVHGMFVETGIWVWCIPVAGMRCWREEPE